LPWSSLITTWKISRFDAVLDVHASVRDALQRLSPAALAAFEVAEGSARG
jgi:hypothetical protein